MNKSYFILFALLQLFIFKAYSQATLTNPTSSTTDTKLTELEKTVTELKSRLDQADTKDLVVGKLTFRNQVKIFTIKPKIYDYLPALLDEITKAQIVDIFRKGYKSQDFVLGTDVNTTVHVSFERKALHKVKLTVTLKQKAQSDKIIYDQEVFKQDFFGDTRQQPVALSESSANAVTNALISIESGLFNQVRVDVNGIVFENKRAPVSLAKFDQRTNDRLFDQSGMSYITLGGPDGLLSYDPFTGKEFLIDAAEYRFTPAENTPASYSLTIGTSADSYFKVRLFTDLLGLADQRNPITQLEGSIKAVLNQRNFRNSRWFGLYTGQIRVGIGRFDSKVDTLRLKGKDSFRTDLFRKANYYGQLKLALLSYRGSIDFDLTAGMDVRFANHVYSDTLTKLNDASIFQVSPLAELSFRKDLGPNFNVLLTLGGFRSRPNQRPTVINGDQWNYLPYISAETEWAPFRNPSSRVFLRFNHCWNATVVEPTITQVQLGYTGSINNFLSLKKNDL